MAVPVRVVSSLNDSNVDPEYIPLTRDVGVEHSAVSGDVGIQHPAIKKELDIEHPTINKDFDLEYPDFKELDLEYPDFKELDLEPSVIYKELNPEHQDMNEEEEEEAMTHELDPEYPANNNELDQENPVNNKELDQENPANNKELDPEDPVINKELDPEYPAINKELDPEHAVINKELDPEPSATNTELNSEYTTINKELDPECPATNKELDPEYPAINKELDSEHAVINKELDPEPSATNTELDPEYPTINKVLDPEYPAINKELDLDHPVICKELDQEHPAVNGDAAIPELACLNQKTESVGDRDVEVDIISMRLLELQEELLMSLKEDISDWIIKTLGNADISASNFITALDTGIILCKLSMVIEKKAQERSEQRQLTEPLPNYKLRCNETATSGTWYARDNTANFLKWCRAYGMTDESLFDTEDLVTHHHERQVIYCLMELARLGVRFGLEPPNLISMEKEIDNQLSPILDKEDPSTDGKECSTLAAIKMLPNVMEPNRLHLSTGKVMDSGLDAEVYRVCVRCHCESFVNKLSEGVFNVYGRRVFIRLLKGKHLMVRVGGGWDTFENYLVHHIPVQVLRFNHSRSGHCLTHTSTLSGQHVRGQYLVIRSKYKSSSFTS